MPKDNANSFFESLIQTYLKEKGRYPNYDKLIEFLTTSEDNSLIQLVPIMKSLGEEGKAKFNEELMSCVDRNIRAKSSVKGKVILKRIYEDSKNDFTEFFKMNLTRDISNPMFNEIGKRIKEKIDSGADELVKTMEGGSKYAQFSSSTADSYFKNIKTFFPYIDFVGVQIKYLGK